MNPNTADFWKRLQPGSVITLKDEKSLLVNMDGVETVVKRILTLPECQGLCTWLMLELEEASSKPTRWLMVKMVDDTIGYNLYTIPPKFDRGNRPDLVINSEGEIEGHWLFQEPEEEQEELDLLALVYTNDFEWEGVTYRKKAQGDFNCGDFDGGESVVERPKPTGIDYHQIATLAEYIADDSKAVDSEALVFEIGDADDDDGGLISIMIGYPLSAHDLDILAK